jgi:hypothetical protein
MMWRAISGRPWSAVIEFAGNKLEPAEETALVALAASARGRSNLTDTAHHVIQCIVSPRFLD